MATKFLHTDAESEDKRSNPGLPVLQSCNSSHVGSIVMVELMQVPIVLVFSVFIPSLFKFVTGNREVDEEVSGGETSDGEGPLQQVSVIHVVVGTLIKL